MSYDLTKLKGSIPPLITPFKDGAVDYDHSDAHGFIRLNALRLRVKKMVQDG